MLSRIPSNLMAQLRNAELKAITAAFQTGCRITISGDNGVGKSTLLKECKSLKLNLRCSDIIDLAAAKNRSLLGLATTIVGAFDPSITAGFYALAVNARQTNSEKESHDAVRLCEELLLKPLCQEVLFLFDNTDRASLIVRQWLFQKVLQNDRIRSIATVHSRDKAPNGSEIVPLANFTRSQLRELANGWKDVENDKHPKDTEELLLRVCAGHPVQATMALWAMSIERNAVSHDPLTLSDLLSAALNKLSVIQLQSIISTIAAHYRCSADILSYFIKPQAMDESYRFIQSLPFVSEIDDQLGGVIVHPIALEYLQEEMRSEKANVQAKRDAIARLVYPRLMSVEMSYELLRSLELEKLRYLTESLSSKIEEEIYTVFHRDVLERRVIRAEEVAQIVTDVSSTPGYAKRLNFELIIAENYLLRDDVNYAITILDGVRPEQLSDYQPDLRARFGYLQAKCITSPASPIGNHLFDAPPLLERAVSDAKEKPELANEIRCELALSLRLIGQDIKALEYYGYVENHSTNVPLIISAAEEQSHIYRIMNDLPNAEAAANRGTSYCLEHDLPISGIGLYYLANIRRDQNRFDSAESLYSRALPILRDLGDNCNSCALLGDWAWLKFHQRDLKGSASLLEEYGKQAQDYRFNRELSEYWHMKYHLEADKEEWSIAYNYLERALKLAKDFGNITMHLDCLMHKVQKAVREGDIASTFEPINELRQIEQHGCGIKVFLGRSLVYQADGFDRMSRETDAILGWKEGFETVALFGNSRSNIDMLEDLLKPRRVRFFRLLKKFNKFNDWPRCCPKEIYDPIEQVLSKTN